MCNNSQPDDPELLLYHLDFNRSTIEQALAITAEYVAQHKLILTGGTAIDMALRSKGTSIYADDALPDYDIISEDNLRHATALAEILCKDGYKDINVIGAIHITTVRVRIKNITLLDATYLPPNLMERIPYLDIGQFRVIHPDYQKIDQRLSLSTLLADTGISLNIFNRLKKDIKRNQILREQFGLVDDGTPVQIKTNRIRIPVADLKFNPDHMQILDKNCFIYTGDICISGFAAYALYYREYGKSHKPLEGTVDPETTLTDKELAFDLPTDAGISLLNCSDRVRYVLEQISGKKKDEQVMYNMLANLKPITARAPFKNSFIEISDTYGTRYSCIQLEGMVVASIDYLLMQFLRDRFYGETEQLRYANTLYYKSLLAMALDRQHAVDTNKIWYPTINTYGFDILPEYKAFGLQKILDPTSVATYKPKNSYLRVPQCISKSKFDPALSHYFQMDGLPNPQIEHTNLKWIYEQIKLAPSST